MPVAPIVAVNTPKRGKNQMNPNKPKAAPAAIRHSGCSSGRRFTATLTATSVKATRPKPAACAISVAPEKISPTAGGATPRLMAFCQRAGKALPAIDQQIDSDARRHAGNPSCEWRIPIC
jgi:hypothetical protein